MFGPLAAEQWKHLRVHDAGACRQPLHVACTKPRGGAKRIRVIDVAPADDRHRLESAVRVLREAGHDVTVIHPPAVDAGKVLSDVMPGQRRGGTKLIVALRVVIDVMNAEQEGVDGLPALTEGFDGEDGIVHH